MPSRFVLACVIASLSATPLSAQDMPIEYAGILKTLARQGDYKEAVLKVNIPRNDLRVVVDGIATPTPFGFGGWIAFTKGDGGLDVVMGDLVLTEEEVNPVMSAVLDNGLDVTALHNHFFFESPRIFYMHVHGHGTAAALAAKIRPALDRIGRTSARPAGAAVAGRTLDGSLDTKRLATIIGHEGEQGGAVYKITIGRPDIPLREQGAVINARMGLNTWAAFYGSDAEAVVAGDIAMLAPEVTSVLRALRANGLDVVALHHHMTGTQPTVIFLHYWGKGPAQKLASGVRAAIDQTGKPGPPGH
jgi:hypothetical protein